MADSPGDAEEFEGRETEARCLGFDVDGFEAEFFCESGERDEWCGCKVGEAGVEGFDFGGVGGCVRGFPGAG